MVLADGRVRALLGRGEISEQAIVRAAVGAEAMQEAAA